MTTGCRSSSNPIPGVVFRTKKITDAAITSKLLQRPSTRNSLQMTDRLITPSQLSLFSRSPVIGAWWEEVHATDPKRAPRPEVKALDDLLFEAGHEHEQVLIAQLKREDKRVAELRGKQDASDYEECLEAMRSGADYIWQASMHSS